MAIHYTKVNRTQNEGGPFELAFDQKDILHEQTRLYNNNKEDTSIVHFNAELSGQ